MRLLHRIDAATLAKALARQHERARLADGGGLYLSIRAQGHPARWLFRYKVDGQQFTQRTLHGKRWSYRSQGHSFLTGTVNNKSADQDVITCLNHQAGGNIDCARDGMRRCGVQR